ncbi:hypothetical protein C1Y40_05383 [Mycobacterium talmoniae]|uniref:Uncharacterized protein n=1 Tax=Mycobacterium talmoniae TaxID=1858794 RepID=A0A2S8BCR1_9MYCO|nr:hypothetical protein C1Y40_05383 [Mycobacterium talmoniae]
MPRSQAYTSASSGTASSRVNTTTPTPSPSTKPSALASKGRHTPDLDTAPILENSTRPSGTRFRCTPATTAMSHCPARSASTALYSATSDDAQAASMAIDGPRRLKLRVIAAAAMFSSEPGMVNARTGGTAAANSSNPVSLRAPNAPVLNWVARSPAVISSRKSLAEMPTYTPTFRLDSVCSSSPALSSAARVAVSRIRCCGSITSACRGEIPKSSGSNRSMSVTVAITSL